MPATACALRGGCLNLARELMKGRGSEYATGPIHVTMAMTLSSRLATPHPETVWLRAGLQFEASRARAIFQAPGRMRPA